MTKRGDASLLPDTTRRWLLFLLPDTTRRWHLSPSPEAEDHNETMTPAPALMRRKAIALTRFTGPVFWGPWRGWDIPENGWRKDSWCRNGSPIGRDSVPSSQRHFCRFWSKVPFWAESAVLNILRLREERCKTCQGGGYGREGGQGGTPSTYRPDTPGRCTVLLRVTSVYSWVHDGPPADATEGPAHASDAGNRR